MDMMQMMNQMMGPWGTGVMWLNFLTGVLFLVLLIVGIVAIAKWVSAEGSWRGQTATETALDILKQRYARGELTKEKFAAKKQDIA